jgi:hypothetical protein
MQAIRISGIRRTAIAAVMATLLAILGGCAYYEGSYYDGGHHGRGYGGHGYGYGGNDRYDWRGHDRHRW